MFPRSKLLFRLTRRTSDIIQVGYPIASLPLITRNQLGKTLQSIRYKTSIALVDYDQKLFKKFDQNCGIGIFSKASNHGVAGTLSDIRIHTPPYVDPQVSYAHGRSNRELKNFTLGPLFEEYCREKPDSIAVVFSDQNIVKTYKELLEDIDRLATGMALKADLKRGDAIGLYAYNTYESLLIYYASNRLGLTLNPFNPSYKSHELNHVLHKSNIKCLFLPGINSSQVSLNDHWNHFCESDYVKLASNESSIGLLRNIVILDGQIPANDNEKLPMSNVQIHAWNQIVAEKPNDLVRDMMKKVTPDDIYCVYYTSGTTGQPKGATITQFNAINCTTLTTPKYTAQRPNRMKPIDLKVCCPLPLFHAFAGIMGALSPFVPGGGPAVYTGAKYNIAGIVEAIRDHKCNSIFLTPTVLIDLLGHVENNNNVEDLNSLKVIFVGGSKVIPETVRKAWRSIKGLEDFRVVYGSSENGVVATIQNCEESDESKLHTVGSPLDLTEVRIVDPQTGATKPLGEPGEVQTRGFNTMIGYLGDPNRTREVITEARWYRTGDMGTMNSQGNIQIVGRIKELIIKGGENIYPAEVETVLHQLDDIKDAQVFGVPDPRFGEEVAVWIKLEGKSLGKDEEKLKKDILSFCNSKLTYFKVPKYVLFVDDFPMTPVKKIKKFEMRAKSVEMLKLKS